MLPDLSSPLLIAIGIKRMAQKVFPWLMACLLSAVLSSCATYQQPPRDVVLQALSLQIQLTQTAIARSLDLEPIGAPEVRKVKIQDREPFDLGDQKGLRLSGHFDWQLPDDQVQVDSAFELFLEQGEQGQSWRLAQPKGSGDGVAQNWTTYPLGIDPIGDRTM